MRPTSLALALVSLCAGLGWQPTKAETPLAPTTLLATDDPWTSERYQLGGGNNSRQANQYGPTIGSGAPSVAPPASPLDRVQGAVVGTAGTLRDGVEAGIKQANQQLNQTGSQIYNGTVNTSRDVGQKFQNVTGAGGQSPSSPGAAWPAPPPVLANTTGTSSAGTSGFNTQSSLPASGSGWTSIRADMAPPRLLPPPLLPVSTSSVAMNNGAGPSFPTSAPPLNGSNSSATNGFNTSSPTSQYHSLLTDPTSDSRQNGVGYANSGQTTTKAPDFSSGWGASAPTQTTSGRSNDSSSGANSAPPRVGPEVPRSSAGNFSTEADPWNRPLSAASPGNSSARSGSATTGAVDRYGQPVTSVTSPQNGSSLWADYSSQPTTPSASTPPAGSGNQSAFGNQPLTNFGNSPNQQNAGQPVAGQSNFGQPYLGQAAAGQPVGNITTPGFGNQGATMNAQAINPDQLPWIPLLVVSVSLAGSLGANLFLGWSYADARHRYHSLVRKTTESFHRATAAAA
jgi:hypothetical protein